jgi:hypothetical protein
MSENLKLYNAVRAVPAGAQKTIKGGRLKGFTDINPMWRIKTLTEQFGPCGVGWYYEITDRWVESSMAKDEITANVIINLYIKHDGEWSKPMQGIGGSMLVANESKGLYVNDECFKMALTDAIGVACKSLGMGADIYWEKDSNKYNDDKKENFDAEMNKPATKTQKETLTQYAEQAGSNMADILKYCGINSIDNLTAGMYGKVMLMLKKKIEGK